MLVRAKNLDTGVKPAPFTLSEFSVPCQKKRRHQYQNIRCGIPESVLHRTNKVRFLCDPPKPFYTSRYSISCQNWCKGWIRSNTASRLFTKLLSSMSWRTWHAAHERKWHLFLAAKFFFPNMVWYNETVSGHWHKLMTPNPDRKPTYFTNADGNRSNKNEVFQKLTNSTIFLVWLKIYKHTYI